LALYGNDVLETYRYSVQRTEGFAFCPAFVGSPGLSKKILVVTVQKGMHFAIDPVDLIKVGPSDFLGLAGSSLEFARQLGCGFGNERT
jgi:hypothetical protein